MIVAWILATNLSSISPLLSKITYWFSVPVVLTLIVEFPSTFNTILSSNTIAPNAFVAPLITLIEFNVEATTFTDDPSVPSFIYKAAYPEIVEFSITISDLTKAIIA